MSGNKARHKHRKKLKTECRIPACSAYPAERAFVQTFFADLVVLAEEFHPIPFRTRPLKPPAPMVLRPKPRESRSLPGLPRTFAQPKRERAEARQDSRKGSRHHKSAKARPCEKSHGRVFALRAFRATREISRGFCFERRSLVAPRAYAMRCGRE